MNNSIKLPVAALSVAIILCIFTFASIVARQSMKSAGGTPNADQALVTQGRKLYGQFRCAACHSVSGAAGAGPALNGIYLSTVPLDNGQTVLADEAYLRESIVDPNAKIVEGYQPNVMAGGIAGVRDQLNSEGTLNALIAYIKSLSPGAAGTPAVTPGGSPVVRPSAPATP